MADEGDQKSTVASIVDGAKQTYSSVVGGAQEQAADTKDWATDTAQDYTANAKGLGQLMGDVARDRAQEVKASFTGEGVGPDAQDAEKLGKREKDYQQTMTDKAKHEPPAQGGPQ